MKKILNLPLTLQPIQTPKANKLSRSYSKSPKIQNEKMHIPILFNRNINKDTGNLFYMKVDPNLSTKFSTKKQKQSYFSTLNDEVRLDRHHPEKNSHRVSSIEQYELKGTSNFQKTIYLFKKEAKIQQNDELLKKKESLKQDNPENQLNLTLLGNKKQFFSQLRQKRSVKKTFSKKIIENYDIPEKVQKKQVYTPWSTYIEDQ